jgi:hypothetical protein
MNKIASYEDKKIINIVPHQNKMQNDINWLVENKEVLGGQKTQDWPARWLIPIANLPEDKKYLAAEDLKKNPNIVRILLYQNIDETWEIY